MDNIINPNAQRVMIDGNAVISEFFNSIFSRMAVESFKKAFPKEEREAKMDEIYNVELDRFNVFMKDLQMQDLGGYMKIKAAIEGAFKTMKEAMMNEDVKIVKE